MPPVAIFILAAGVSAAVYVAPPVGRAIKKAAVKTEHVVTAPPRFLVRKLHHRKGR